MSETESDAPIPDPLTFPDLALPADLKLTVVNERVVIREHPGVGWRVVLVSGVPFARFSSEDKVSQRFACATLRLLGLAGQEEISAAFGHGRASQARWEKLYREEGL